jgi:hypothetical protein
MYILEKLNLNLERHQSTFFRVASVEADKEICPTDNRYLIWKYIDANRLEVEDTTMSIGCFSCISR